MLAIVTDNVGFYKQVFQMLQPVSSRIKIEQIIPGSDEASQSFDIAVTDGKTQGIVAWETFIIADEIPDEVMQSDGVRFFMIGEFEASDFTKAVESAIERSNSVKALRQRLKSAVSNVSDTEEELRQYKRSTKSAGALQHDVMTGVRLTGFESAVYYRPCAVVSGDFLLIEDMGDKVFAMIGDVTDHGYFAGLYGTSLYSLAKGYLHMASKFEQDIVLWARYLYQSGSFFQGDFKRDATATAILCEIDKTKQIARFLSLGHADTAPIVINPDGTANFVDFEYHYIPIGDFSRNAKAYSPDCPTEIKFKRGSSLLLYTDGITETFQSKDVHDSRKIYSKNRLLASVENKISNDWTPASLVEGVKRDVASYCISRVLNMEDIQSGRKLSEIDTAEDDITLACIRWSNPTEEFYKAKEGGR